MARRERDYRKELAQRNAKAQRLGYSTYRQLRNALASGKVVRGNDDSIEFPRKRFRHAWVQAGFPNTEEGKLEYAQMQRENREWIKNHSHSIRTELPRGASPEVQKAFHDAFVKGKNPDRLLDMKHFLVDIKGTMSAAEFDRKYLKK